MSSEHARLLDFDPDLSSLTEAEREATSPVGRTVSVFARRTDRRPGTIGNLLARAADRLEEGSA